MAIKAAFLDRDGVINKKPPDDPSSDRYWVTSVEEFAFNPGIFPLLARLAKEEFQFIVITNQRGIALGRMTEADLEAIHVYMRAELARRGITLLDILFCPHDKGECACRKPQPGMLYQAAAKYDIDIKRSILVSDSADDVEMGKDFGIGLSILIRPNHPEAFF
jgi:D-glycero-D-manno-heptose 1,7-bisphosphate phosphatase